MKTQMCEGVLLLLLLALFGLTNGAHTPPVNFFSGMNQAWNQYANDFGNNAYASTRSSLLDGLSQIQASGGNIVRTWLHTNCANTPKFDASGRVVDTDGSGTLISDVQQYLRDAQARGIRVLLTLFNGAAAMDAKLVGLLTDSAKLQSYIDKALTPLIAAIRAEPGLHSIDIVNEFDGSLLGKSVDPEPCFDSSAVSSGWNGNQLYSMKAWLAFVNRLASAIHDASPSTQVTVGASKIEMISNAFFAHAAYLSDACLVKAGGKTNGVLDYYQAHSYLQWVSGADPFFHSAPDYKLDKQIMMGEADHDENNEYNHGSWTGATVYRFFFNHGYSGMLGWAVNDPSSPHFSLAEHIKGMIAIADGNGCADTAPASGSCASAVSGGSCMNADVVPAGNCLKSCNACGLPPPLPCSDIAPDNTYTCAQQAAWGKCNQTWMVPSGKCLKTCGACSAQDSCASVSCGSYGTCYRGLCTCSGGWIGTRCEFAPGGVTTAVTSLPPPPPVTLSSTAGTPVVVNDCATNNGGCGPTSTTLCTASATGAALCSCVSGYTGNPPTTACSRSTPPACAFSATDEGSNNWWLAYSIQSSSGASPKSVVAVLSGGQTVSLSGPNNWGTSKPAVYTSNASSVNPPFALLVTDAASGAQATITVSSFSSGTTFSC